MAQYNNVHLYGIAAKDAKSTRDDITGAVLDANVVIITLSSARKYEGSNEGATIEFNHISVRAGIPEMAKKIAKIRQNDIVVLKGTLNTRNVPKAVTCSACSERYNAVEPGEDMYKAQGMITFVTPIDIDIRNTDFGNRTSNINKMLISEDEKKQKIRQETLNAINSIIEHREMSNEVQIIGNLCADPAPQENGRATAYQIGINRNFYLKDDLPSVSSDYPYVRSYGRQADSDMEHLQKGSLVLVDGFLRIRKFLRTTKCPACGFEKTWEANVMEIVPYTVQYLGGIKEQKEISEERG